MIYLKNINREKGLQKINRDLLNDYQKIDKIQSKSRNNYQKLKNNNPLLITQQDYLINSTNDINSSDNSRKIYKTMENRIPKIKMNLNLKHKIHQSDIKKQRKIMAQNILIGNYMNEISDRIKISYLSKKDKNEVNDNKKRKPIHLPSLSVNLPQKIYQNEINKLNQSLTSEIKEKQRIKILYENKINEDEIWIEQINEDIKQISNWIFNYLGDFFDEKIEIQEIPKFTPYINSENINNYNKINLNLLRQTITEARLKG